MFRKVECVTDDNSILVYMGEYSIFHVFHKVRIEEQIDIVKSFQISMEKIVLDKCNVLVSI